MSIGDGGLPPGGAPGRQTCDCGPCPVCSDVRQQSSPCALSLGHGDPVPHMCPLGHTF